VYKLSDDLAIIQTVDFITPIVDDPHTFGQVAAANALSDVYAMGGRPITALNVVGFPIKSQDISVLNDILRGGLTKMQEAGVTLVGGHSVEDDELKYGLAVTGVVHPLSMITRDGARVGDRLILTKPLGTGLVSTAVKGGMAEQQTVDRVAGVMTALNRTASELMIEAGCHACTDITGFGFLGHASGMVEDSPLGMEVNVSAIPTLPEAKTFAEMGLVPAGTYRNREFRSGMIETAGDISDDTMNILFDPQTSGGLLIAVPAEEADALLQKLHQRGVADAAIVGAITAGPKRKIVIRE
jgi:selenide,water dikinase